MNIPEPMLPYIIATAALVVDIIALLAILWILKTPEYPTDNPRAHHRTIDAEQEAARRTPTKKINH